MRFGSEPFASSKLKGPYNLRFGEKKVRETDTPCSCEDVNMRPLSFTGKIPPASQLLRRN